MKRHPSIHFFASGRRPRPERPGGHVRAAVGLLERALCRPRLHAGPVRGHGQRAVRLRPSRLLVGVMRDNGPHYHTRPPSWWEGMPITKMERTLLDCVSWGAPTYLMRQAVDVTLRDGLIVRRKSCGLLHAEFTVNGTKWRRGLACEERAVANPRHPAWHAGRGRTLAWGGAWP